jgi:type VI secretion system protein ImpK
MIELIYTALALGFEGPFRTDARGPLLLIQYRERLLAAIRLEAANQASPSVSLTAGSGTHKALAYLNPFTMTLAGVLFVVASLAVAVWVFGDTGPKFIAQAPADLSVLRTPELLPRPDPVPARVRALIETDVATKLVSFDGSGPSMIVGVAGDTLFQSGTAAPDKANDGVVRRLGAAIVAASGPVTIIAQRNPAAPDLAPQRIAALGRMLAPWLKDRELHPMSFVIDPAGGQPPEQDIQIVLGKGVRPPPLAGEAYPVLRWY